MFEYLYVHWAGGGRVGGVLSFLVFLHVLLMRIYWITLNFKATFLILGAFEGDWRTRERSAKIDVLVEQLADAVNAATNHLDVVERQMETYTSSDTTLSQKQVGAKGF